MKEIIKKIYDYVNPINHLGERSYSWKFPLITVFMVAVLSEFYAYEIVKDPKGNGLIAIFVYIALIIYFSFREGIRGGVTASVVAVLYYFYIVFSRENSQVEVTEGVQTILFLGTIYLFISGTVGWLRQTLDSVIERESDGRRRLETIIQQLPVGIVITDKDGTVVQVNKQVAKILGVNVPPGHKISEQTIMSFKKEGQETNSQETPIYRALKEGETTVNEEYVMEGQDKPRFLQVSAAAIRNRDNRVIAAATIIADNTSQKEMEMRKDDFVNMASHELKTPLTSMKLYVESLEKNIDKYGDEKVGNILNNIKSQTYRLQKLVNDLLDVSRLQTGKLTFEQNRFRLDELAEETIDILQNTARDQDIILVEKQNITANGDKFRIYQVITNLINNAIKYSQMGQNILVRVYKKEDMAIVSVQDFGLGIDKSEHERIFERLYQVNDDTRKTFPGFGMGLFISKEVILRHKGKIWVESEKGKGSTFYFSLPLQNI